MRQKAIAEAVDCLYIGGIHAGIMQLMPKLGDHWCDVPIKLMFLVPYDLINLSGCDKDTGIPGEVQQQTIFPALQTDFLA